MPKAKQFHEITEHKSTRDYTKIKNKNTNQNTHTQNYRNRRKKKKNIIFSMARREQGGEGRRLLSKVERAGCLTSKENKAGQLSSKGGEASSCGLDLARDG